jgi:hypothetical protein
MTIKSREIHLRARPQGAPTLADFELAEVVLPEPADGEVAVRNRFLSVDPYMRGRMNDVKSYVPPFALGKPLEGGALGEVVASRVADLPVGALVTSMYGWREAFVAPAAMVRAVPPTERPSDYLGVLGLTGLTAWYGLELVGVKAGDRVFVSAAAGAVGIIAGQLAKLRGCRVVGSAGGPDKVAMLTRELGFDAAFDYKAGRLTEQLAAAAPDGIDVYFDNVGGDHLEAALNGLRPFGRVIACGMISRYNDERPAPGPSNLSMIVGKRLTIKGFIVSDAMARLPEMIAEVAPLLAAGTLHVRETVIEGIARTPEAFLALLAGGNTGKMLVKV